MMSLSPSIRIMRILFTVWIIYLPEEAFSLVLPVLPKFAKRFVSSVALVTALTADPTCAAEFDFPNGHVQIDEPLILNLSHSKNHRSFKLVHPVLVGYGGGGSVYAFDYADDDDNNNKEDDATTPPLVKISWSDSADSVRRECTTLQYLESKGVISVERCLGAVPYPHQDDDAEDGSGNNKNNRVMIAVTPYVADAVASVRELETAAQQTKAVQQIAQTLVQMLAHDIVTIDVQPLISQTTADVIFIDMTEAVVLHPPFSFLDQTLLGSFCSEMLALIPDDDESLVRVAAASVRAEVERLAAQGTQLSPEARDILFGQTLLFPDE
eukprot:scaffold286_cov169-Amphora_coffeaeformis.AAC.23